MEDLIDSNSYLGNSRLIMHVLHDAAISAQVRKKKNIHFQTNAEKQEAEDFVEKRKSRRYSTL